MKIPNRIKSFFKNHQRSKLEKVVFSKRQCPHCVSRGMFVFNTNPKIKLESEIDNEKNH